MLKLTIQNDMKAAMKGGEKRRLGVIRLILAAIKQIEVDQRIELTDEQILAVLDKMTKQRRDSLEQYKKAEREDLAEQESYELEVLKAYLPEALSDEEVDALIAAAITDSGAESARDMGKVMGILKPKLQGRADMGKVSGLVKQKLNS
jgi:uncharacterized protein YqeY